MAPDTVARLLLKDCHSVAVSPAFTTPNEPVTAETNALVAITELLPVARLYLAKVSMYTLSPVSTRKLLAGPMGCRPEPVKPLTFADLSGTNTCSEDFV